MTQLTETTEKTLLVINNPKTLPEYIYEGGRVYPWGVQETQVKTWFKGRGRPGGAACKDMNKEWETLVADQTTKYLGVFGLTDVRPWSMRESKNTSKMLSSVPLNEVLEVSRSYNLPLIYTSDSHYLLKSRSLPFMSWQVFKSELISLGLDPYRVRLYIKKFRQGEYSEVPLDYSQVKNHAIMVLNK